MSLYPYSSTRPGRAATATSALNDFPAATAGKKNNRDAAFLIPGQLKTTGDLFASGKEKTGRTFSPFGGSWDYSEVD